MTDQPVLMDDQMNRREIILNDSRNLLIRPKPTGEREII
jgi:hypothetical protein